ncbi:MAG TPA: hypothetical protein VJS12_07680 [Steroidobacteraceae bacterium]|nr:hypothetical protein [Steroidobacteraceae bacterium]
MNATKYWLEFAGAVSALVQIAGTLLMANVLITVRFGKLRYMLFALWRAKSIKNDGELSEGLNKDDKVKSAQGLSLLFIGFLIDFVCAVIKTCMSQ